jgi:hypothetical protein
VGGGRYSVNRWLTRCVVDTVVWMLERRQIDQVVIEGGQGKEGQAGDKAVVQRAWVEDVVVDEVVVGRAWMQDDVVEEAAVETAGVGG